jgi:hypothetical protein
MFVIEVKNPWISRKTECIVASFDGRRWVTEKNGGRVSPRHITVISSLCQRD